MARIAVLYDTTEGQTAKIARRVAETATNLGHDVTTEDLRNLPDGFQLAAFDGIIVGASIHVGKHARPVTDFVKQNRHRLETVPSAYFSVSLSAAGKSERQQQDAQRVLNEFLSETGWTPQKTAAVAGALLYREYGVLKRLVMKWIASKEGGDTDTSRNYEYTDWDGVQRFTEEFLRQFGEEL